MNRPERSAAHDVDFFAWTQGQASALRDISTATIGNHLDIINVAEEIEDLGRRELRDVKSLLSRVLEHLIKIAQAGDGSSYAHWTVETLVFQRDAFNGDSPSMRQHLDVTDLWRQGGRLAAAALGRDEETLAVPVECPFALDDLLRDSFDIGPVLERLRAFPNGR